MEPRFVKAGDDADDLLAQSQDEEQPDAFKHVCGVELPLGGVDVAFLRPSG